MLILLIHPSVDNYIAELYNAPDAIKNKMNILYYRNCKICLLIHV